TPWPGSRAKGSLVTRVVCLTWLCSAACVTADRATPSADPPTLDTAAGVPELAEAEPVSPSVEPAPASGSLLMLGAVLCFSAMIVCVKQVGSGVPEVQKILIRSAVVIPLLWWMIR